MNKDKHLVIMAILFYSFFNLIYIKKIEKRLFAKFGELQISKFICIFSSLISCFAFYNLLDDKKDYSIFKIVFNLFEIELDLTFINLLTNFITIFLMYGSFLASLFFIFFFTNLKQTVMLPNGSKVDALKLFRSLSKENLLEGRYSDFCNFLLGVKPGAFSSKLIWNHYHNQRFIYKHLISFFLVTFLKTEEDYKKVSMDFFNKRLNLYFDKVNNKTIEVTKDNICKFDINEDIYYKKMSPIFKDCILPQKFLK